MIIGESGYEITQRKCMWTRSRGIYYNCYYQIHDLETRERICDTCIYAKQRYDGDGNKWGDLKSSTYDLTGKDGLIYHLYAESLESIAYTVHDPCANVICDTTCVGDDLYSTVCKEGACVRGAIIEEGAVQCGYVPPESGSKTPWALLGLGVIGLYFFLRR